MKVHGQAGFSWPKIKVDGPDRLNDRKLSKNRPFSVLSIFAMTKIYLSLTSTNSSSSTAEQQKSGAGLPIFASLSSTLIAII